MSKIGLIVIINKYNNFNKYFQNIIKTFELSSLDETRTKLVEYLAEELNKEEIDFPIELDDLRFKWFNETYTDCDIFNYKVYDNNFTEPWDLQDIYSDVYDLMFNKECDKEIDYASLYGEDKLTEENEKNYIESENNLFENIPDDVKEIEKEMKNIISKS
jgi:hypothetical protein